MTSTVPMSSSGRSVFSNAVCSWAIRTCNH